MRADLPRESGRLGWLLRHHAWLVLVCVLGVAGIPLLLGPVTPTYQADALVVARELTVNSRVLPRLGESVFNNGAVAARVAQDPTIDGDGSGLIPRRLSVEVAEDSVVMTVHGRDADPQTAARLANLGAAAFAAELNGGGAGVGQFSVQAPAVPPAVPLRTTSPQLLAAVGALAGLVLGLGLVALLSVLRRPTLTSRDVEQAVGVPLLGRVDVPFGPRAGYPGPIGVRGIATVTRWLASVPAGRLLMISPRSAVAVRQRLYVMIAVALSTVRPVKFRAAGELVDAIEQHRAGLRPAPPRSAAEGELSLVDGGSPMEILDPATASVSVVAVAPRGITQRRLRMLANDYLDAGLVGVVLFEASRVPRRTASGRSPARPAASTGTTEKESSVPEPERA